MALINPMLFHETILHSHSHSWSGESQGYTVTQVKQMNPLSEVYHIGCSEPLIENDMTSPEAYDSLNAAFDSLNMYNVNPQSYPMLPGMEQYHPYHAYIMTSEAMSGHAEVMNPVDPSKASLYKTELCKRFQQTGKCRYGAKCQFAHGKKELRFVLRHPKYKTAKCKSFWTTGKCPYDTRCCFIHAVPDSIFDGTTLQIGKDDEMNFSEPASLDDMSIFGIHPMQLSIQSPMEMQHHFERRHQSFDNFDYGNSNIFQIAMNSNQYQEEMNATVSRYPFPLEDDNRTSVQLSSSLPESNKWAPPVHLKSSSSFFAGSFAHVGISWDSNYSAPISFKKSENQSTQEEITEGCDLTGVQVAEAVLTA